MELCLAQIAEFDVLVLSVVAGCELISGYKIVFCSIADCSILVLSVVADCELISG